MEKLISKQWEAAGVLKKCRMPPKSLRELRTWSGRRRGVETHTISHNTHTACGGGRGGRGNQFHCLPLSKCISIYNPWNSVCVGQCIRNRWINKQRIPCWVFSKCAAFSFVFQLFLLLLLLLLRWFIFILVALCEFRRHRATAKSFGGTRVSVWTRQVEGAALHSITFRIYYHWAIDNMHFPVL